MMTQSELNILNDKLNTKFDRVGLSLVPQSKSNTDTFLWHIYIAKFLESRAKKRREAAMDIAVAARVAPNIKTDTVWLGERVVHTGENIMLSLEVRDRSGGVDIDRFMKALQDAGVSNKIIDNAYVDATKPRTRQHIFTATPLVEGGE